MCIRDRSSRTCRHTAVTRPLRARGGGDGHVAPFDGLYADVAVFGRDLLSVFVAVRNSNGRIHSDLVVTVWQDGERMLGAQVIFEMPPITIFEAVQLPNEAASRIAVIERASKRVVIYKLDSEQVEDTGNRDASFVVHSFEDPGNRDRAQTVVDINGDGLDNHRIIIADSNGNYLSEFGGFGEGPGQFNGIHALAIGPDGLIFALDRANGRVQVFRLTDEAPAEYHPEIEHISVWPGFGLPLDLIVNEEHVWVSDLRPLKMVKLDFDGNRLYTWNVSNDGPAGYLEVHTFSVDNEGNLYGGDNQHGRTQKLIPKSNADPALLIGQPFVQK